MSNLLDLGISDRLNTLCTVMDSVAVITAMFASGSSWSSSLTDELFIDFPNDDDDDDFGTESILAINRPDGMCDGTERVHHFTISMYRVCSLFTASTTALCALTDSMSFEYHRSLRSQHIFNGVVILWSI